ncbi:MAG: TerD family protein [Jatrophihabitans sp.]|uniref:TerD family protein n=1 Tax=Jatrophihabitans sp. TaxID=1932789 RepID=UPI003F7E284D
MAEMKRGANVALTREIPGLSGVVLGMKYSVGAERVLADNLVFAVILVGADGRARSDEDFVFFNQLQSSDASVQRIERAAGDDAEQIEVDLAAVPADIDRIVAVLYVNEGPGQHRTLGQLRSCVLRVLDLADDRELVRSEELARSLATETAIVLGELYRHPSRGADWKFKVLGQGYAMGLAGIAADYGLPL